MTASLRDAERDWVTRASCRGQDPEMWFPSKSGPNNSQEAQRICLACPVRFECRDDAESRDEPFGIWGGVARKGTALGSPHRKTQYRPEPAPGDERPGVFTASCCIKCGLFWSNNSGP